MTATTEEPAAGSRPGRRVFGTSAWIALLVLVVTAFGFVASRTAAPPDHGPPRGDVAAAKQAIDALLAPGPSPDALALLPADFTRVTGVVAGETPAPDGTVRAVHVGGGCSTPWGDDDTRWGFGPACQSHDLGYDLLRYADRKGHPLGPEVREALDDRLSADMHGMCRTNPMDSETTCRAVASLYSAGLVVNSWHQRWGPPVGEPIVPMLAGLAMIGLLVSFRLRGWLLTRRQRPRPARRNAPRPARGRGWTLLGIGSIGVLMLGEATVALARWAGAGEQWLWPFTWLAQLSFLFFFAGGQANAAGWAAIRRAGGGYREYLAHRTSWLLRLTLVFAVVAFAVPTALEVLGIPGATTATVVRIALHPLWLLGVYVLTIVATPALVRVHRRTPVAGVLGLLALVLVTDLAGRILDVPLVGYLSALPLALLAQQLAFAGLGRFGGRRWLPVGVAALGAAALGAGAAVGLVPLTLLGAPEGPPALAGPTLPVLLLGVVQLAVLALVRQPLSRLATAEPVRRAAAFASRAPMTLYLVFLAAMLLVVAVVYLPGLLATDGVFLLRPRPLLAVAMLAGPAVLVFWWFERHLGHHPPAPPAVSGTTGGFERLLAHAATAAGISFATVGVFGFALTTFGGAADPMLRGVLLGPIQSLVHLLLGMALLHAVRTGAAGSPRTWLLATLACVPPLLAAAGGPAADALGVVVHAVTAGLALAAVLATVWLARATSGYAR
ncbi:phospholipase A2 [Prauserella muralis]|uniref:Phospholipase n=1 Tax=Prauserella muralis TaxID=588067 RepID=A0A2V4ALP2_9PSEU|nr:phospholipase A2 [Prauserella muralis]PXY20894.1 phospholipase [Prauserella muralis]TWE29941.1 phospholipase A2-like protein [Prauserella muralis]